MAVTAPADPAKPLILNDFLHLSRLSTVSLIAQKFITVSCASEFALPPQFETTPQQAKALRRTFLKQDAEAQI